MEQRPGTYDAQVIHTQLKSGVRRLSDYFQQHWNDHTHITMCKRVIGSTSPQLPEAYEPE